MISPKMSMTTVLLATTVLAVGVFAASFENFQPSAGGEIRVQVKRTTDAPVQLCGYRLLEAVRGLCGGFVLSRRSDPHSLAPLYEELELPMSNSLDEGSPQYPNTDAFGDNNGIDFPDSDAVSPWGKSPSKLIALQVLAEGKAHPRYRRNIIDECCKRPCTVRHMLKYCART